MTKKIQDIEYGMVFDHLPPGAGAGVFNVLKNRIWPERFCPIIIGSFHSKKKGKKDIAKLDGIHLKEGSPALNEIALLSPHSTVNWIEDERVIKKKEAWKCMADFVSTEMIKCPNHNCISHKEAPGKFHVKSRNPLLMKCHYCERKFVQEETHTKSRVSL
jgi:aspartate carbamoyltransferase regulatory subunit